MGLREEDRLVSDYHPDGKYKYGMEIISPPIAVGAVANRITSSLEAIKLNQQLGDFEKKAFKRGDTLIRQAYQASEMFLSHSMVGYHRGDVAVYEMITEALAEKYKKHSPCFKKELEDLRKKLKEVSKGKKENLEELLVLFSELAALTLEKTTGEREQVFIG